MDYYNTSFVNQVVVDYEKEGTVLFYNLEGNSYSKSLQLKFDINLTPQIEFISAYKNDNVSIDYISGTKQKQLVPLNRYFVNLSWNSIKNIKNKQWKYDFTINGVGNQRIVENSLNSNFNESPSFSIINSQLTRVFSNLFEAYIGIENLGNFTQKNPIIFENDPFNNKFDTSQIWAPILGRMFYLGLRYKI